MIQILKDSLPSTKDLTLDEFTEIMTYSTDLLEKEFK